MTPSGNVAEAWIVKTGSFGRETVSLEVAGGTEVGLRDSWGRQPLAARGNGERSSIQTDRSLDPHHHNLWQQRDTELTSNGPVGGHRS